MKTTTTTTSNLTKLGRAMLLGILIANVTAPTVHAGSVWDSLTHSAVQGEHHQSTVASVAAVRG